MVGPAGRNRKAVFLDRDGVLNKAEVRDGKAYAPRDMESFHLFDDALPSTGALKQAGLLLVVVTNQPDVGNGLVAQASVEEMNKALHKSLPLDDIRVCFHKQTDDCPCRKPKPGMLIEASEGWGIDLKQSFMVGDRWSDVAAGRAAGCYTIFIDRGYSEPLSEFPDAKVASLSEATNLILSHLEKEKQR